MNTNPRPVPLACSSCPHGVTVTKPAPIPEATRLRWEQLASESTPCPYIAAMGEAQS